MSFSKNDSEENRQQTLESFGILNTPPEERFDEIAIIAAEICKTEIALISFVDRDRQWFKSRVGIQATETPRENSFCDYAIASSDLIFEVKNAAEDSRFKNNHLVIGEPKIAFYAGAPLVASNGEKIGTLCVIDSKVYELNERQRAALKALANQVMALLELRERNTRIEESHEHMSELHAQSLRDHRTLEIIFETSSMGLAIVREPDFVFEKVNGAFEKLVGPRKYLKRKWVDVYPEARDSILIDGLKNVYATGERFEQKGYLVSIFDETGNQVDRYYDLSYDRLDADVEGNFGILIQASDVTADLLAQRSLAQNEKVSREAHEKINSILDTVPVGIAVFEGPENVATFTNIAFDRITSDERLIGKKLSDLEASDRLAELSQLLKIVYRSGVDYHSDSRKIASLGFKSGLSQSSFKISCLPLKNFDGRVYGVALTVVDVTELTEARDSARANAVSAQQAELLLQQAVRVAKVGFFDCDIGSDTLTLSEQFQKDWDLPAISSVGEALSRVVTEDRERVGALFKKSLEDRSEYHAEYRILRPSDGQVLWIEAQGKIISAINGQTPKFFGTTINITKRKQAELETYAIANSIAQLAWTAKPSGEIDWYNERWYDYTGTNFEEMQGWGWRSVHDPNHVDRVVKKLKEAFESEVPWEDTFPLRAKDGSYRWFLSQAKPLFDESGKLKKWFGTNTDITEQIKSEQALTRLASVVESSHDFIGMSDAEFNVIFVNEGGRKLTGFGDRDATTSEIVEFFPAAEIPRLKNEVIPTLLDKGYWEGEMFFKHFETGELIPVLYNLFPIIDRLGVTIGYATVTRDISELKKNELALKEARDVAEHANAAKSAFLANMSHEIRTPLGAIMGFSDLARQNEGEPDALRNYLDVVHRNSVQTLKIVDDILDLAKVEAGKVLIELIKTDLISFLADFGSLMGFRARENGIHFILKAETDLPDWIIIDPTRVRQVLNNAVGNAIKFTKSGSVTLHVCYVDHYLKFGITDTGRGISPNQAKNLFQAFVQADESTTRKFGGTGLGLVLTKKLCVQMGGDFTLERSELGVGSHFLAKIYALCPEEFLLLAKEDLHFKNKSKETIVTGQRALEGLTVLVVEDSPDNQELLKIILERQGARFLLAKDGLEGVERATTDQFDVILMDVQMPRMDGHEAVQKMRELGVRKPVLALTAHAMKEEFERAMQSGFTDYLTKPVDKSMLVSMILKYCSKRS